MERLCIIAPVLLTSVLSGCGEPKAERLEIAPDQVCVVITHAITKQGHIQESQIDGCDEISESEDPSGYFLTRLNGVCTEEMCGSVLLGWYAVESTTGRVFEWNVGESTIGPEIGPLD